VATTTNEQEEEEGEVATDAAPIPRPEMEAFVKGTQDA
jgi:hypothetical protein